MISSEYNFFHIDYTVEETEEYLRDVVSKKYNTAQAQRVFAALDLARHAHKDRCRCNNASYIVHPMRVALLLLSFDENAISKVIIAALLHDVLEKTDVKACVIEEQFGRYVLKLVQSVTRDHDDKQSCQEKTLAKRQCWLEAMSGSHEARLIKTCEDLDNMICWKAIPEDSLARGKMARWLMEAREMSLPLARVTNWQAYHLMRQEYDYYVERGFADQPITI